jgi:hypothetical protein
MTNDLEISFCCLSLSRLSVYLSVSNSSITLIQILLVVNSRCDSIIIKLRCSLCNPGDDSMMFTSEWINNVIEFLKKNQKTERNAGWRKRLIERKIDKLVSVMRREKKKEEKNLIQFTINSYRIKMSNKTDDKSEFSS